MPGTVMDQSLCNLPTVDLDSFLADVKNAVDSVTNFPRDIENPSVRKLEWNKTMMRVVVAGEIGEGTYSPWRQLRNQLANLPHISQVEIAASRREVTIQLSERDLQNFGLSFSDVANAIR